MMPKLVIFADDFSSVTDCGVQFSKHGLSTLALANIPKEPLPKDIDILSVDGDSRALSSQEAYQKTYDIAQHMSTLNPQRSYKSIDSLIRGNLGSEIDAVMDAFGYEAAIVAPAFPYYGRTTIKGRHFLHGVPLHETALANDPACPCKESDLLALLRAQSKREAALLPQEVLRGEKEAFVQTVLQLVSNKAELILPDIETEEDLHRLAEYSLSLPKVLLAGSTGLARHLATGWGWAREGDTSPEIEVQNLPALLVSGSVSPVTQEQIEQVLAQENVLSVCLNPAQVLEKGIENYNEQALLLAKQQKNLVLYLNANDAAQRESDKLGKQKGWSRAQMAEMLSAKLALLVEQITEECEFSGLILTGGDTAISVCRKLDMSAMLVLSEVEAGIPVCKTMPPLSWHIVTKSGAFGSSETLLCCLRAITTI